ncbi:MAG TPA: hypothetical protein VN650_12495 [Gemmatimonadaceae bacterium]|jgi:hypothetical protein|nr:hypothetical protein [Gemmatimonadaceae bacterium]
MGRFLPADHDAGDANTVGGYRAVHSRPAAFEGRDGASYSVDIVVDEVREPAGRFGAYLLFVHWRRGDPSAAGHLETDYIAFGETEDAARTTLGAMRLSDAKRTLDDLITRAQTPERPWYDVMRDS